MPIMIGSRGAGSVAGSPFPFRDAPSRRRAPSRALRATRRPPRRCLPPHGDTPLRSANRYGARRDRASRRAHAPIRRRTRRRTRTAQRMLDVSRTQKAAASLRGNRLAQCGKDAQPARTRRRADRSPAGFGRLLRWVALLVVGRADDHLACGIAALVPFAEARARSGKQNVDGIAVSLEAAAPSPARRTRAP